MSTQKRKWKKRNMMTFRIFNVLWQICWVDFSWCLHQKLSMEQPPLPQKFFPSGYLYWRNFEWKLWPSFMVARISQDVSWNRRIWAQSVLKRFYCPVGVPSVRRKLPDLVGHLASKPLKFSPTRWAQTHVVVITSNIQTPTRWAQTCYNTFNFSTCSGYN